MEDLHLWKSLIQVVNLLAAVGVIVLVLLQQGKGADAGAAFGTGSAGSLFGSSGSANFLSRATKYCAIIFFASLIGLVLIESRPMGKADAGVMSTVVGDKPAADKQAAPVAPAQDSKQGSIPN